MKNWVIGKSSIVAGQLWHCPGGGSVVIPHCCQMGVFHHLAFTETPRRKDTASLPPPPQHCGLYWYRDGEAVLTAGKSCEPLIPMYLFLTLTQQGENRASHYSHVRVEVLPPLTSQKGRVLLWVAITSSAPCSSSSSDTLIGRKLGHCAIAWGWRSPGSLLKLCWESW